MNSHENENHPKTLQSNATNFLRVRKYMKIIEVSAIKFFTEARAAFDM